MCKVLPEATPKKKPGRGTSDICNLCHRNQCIPLQTVENGSIK